MDHYKTTHESYNKLAKAYQDRFMDLDIYHSTYDLFCETVVKPNAEIFEVACGPGNITRYILARRADYKIFGTDVAPNMIALARINNPAASFEVMDCRDISRINRKYDAVLCGFCMPYITREDCAQLFSDCSGMLETGGIFYFSAMEGDYENSGYEYASNGIDKSFIYYHSEQFLMSEAGKNGLELLHLVRQEYKKHDGRIVVDLIFITRKK
jgi:predicted TPR repeat methyltransferase